MGRGEHFGGRSLMINEIDEDGYFRDEKFNHPSKVTVVAATTEVTAYKIQKFSIRFLPIEWKKRLLKYLDEQLFFDDYDIKYIV